jgi:hypothetical protein
LAAQQWSGSSLRALSLGWNRGSQCPVHAQPSLLMPCRQNLHSSGFHSFSSSFTNQFDNQHYRAQANTKSDLVDQRQVPEFITDAVNKYVNTHRTVLNRGNAEEPGREYHRIVDDLHRTRSKGTGDSS